MDDLKRAATIADTAVPDGKQDRVAVNDVRQPAEIRPAGRVKPLEAAAPTVDVLGFVVPSGAFANVWPDPCD